MDPAKKRDIMDDLDAFRNGKDYHARFGKAWMRGYLLHGPPGIGKSAMIAAMANYLDYDIYDVVLIELQGMLIETKGRSIIVIHDIDLTGKCKKTKPPPGADETGTKVTLSGLLNVFDELWSVWGAEQIIIFTTACIGKLDPALIQCGRMDKHIEMSYCCFQAFKFLAKNYLGIDEHLLFDDIKVDAEVTPADVAEHLMLRCDDGEEDSCLLALVKALQKAKEKAMAKNEKAMAKKKEIVDHGETVLLE